MRKWLIGIGLTVSVVGTLGLAAVGVVLWQINHETAERCDEVLDIRGHALDEFGDSARQQGADVVGPRCANSDGGLATVEAYFNRADLPIEFMGTHYTAVDLDADRRVCIHGSDGTRIEVMQLAAEPIAVASGAAYDVGC